MRRESRRPDRRCVAGILDAAEMAAMSAIRDTPEAHHVPVGLFMERLSADLKTRLEDERFGDLYPFDLMESMGLKDRSS